MELSEIRREIDDIDDQLIRLLCRRMDCSARVAEYKAAQGIPVLSQTREDEIIARVRAAGDDCRKGTETPRLWCSPR